MNYHICMLSIENHKRNQYENHQNYFIMIPFIVIYSDMTLDVTRTYIPVHKNKVIRDIAFFLIYLLKQ